MTIQPGYSLYPEEKISTITELTLNIQSLLEEGFPRVWVSGEIGSLSRPSSGHIYMNLKDAQAQIRAVIWRSKAVRLRCELREGLEVIVAGRITVYPARGEYQLIIDEVEPKGIGIQDLALRQLKKKLLALGYFATERKRPLPRFPRHIALVTSRSGAAVRDMLEILGRRWPLARVLVSPVRVQGRDAERDIAQALRRVNRLSDIDVVLLGRGGGASEDLAAFNTEGVARAIFESRIPVISAVGHEIDLTIADLVADQRALTPSEAAELATPDRQILIADLRQQAAQLATLLRRHLQTARQRLGELARRRVFAQPLERIRERERRLEDLEARLHRAARRRVTQDRQKIEAWTARIDTLSPLNVLARGYSLTRRESDQVLVRNSEEVTVGERVVIRLARGELVSRVEEKS
jgi:exodeoxyribonuclease VII large subunit